MSSPWRITRGDQQFTVKDVAELKLMAADSKIESNDLIQCPGGTEWLYATEVTELSGLIKIKPVEEDDDDFGFGRRKRGSSPFVRKLAAGLTIAMLGAAFFGLYYIYSHRPDPESTKLFGGGTDDLKPLDALATENAALLSQPDSGASQVGVVKANSRVKLTGRQGDFFAVTTASGETGWVGTKQVAPGYLFDATSHERWEPFFYPEEYIIIQPLSWTNRDEDDKPETLTDMLFAINNPTDFGISGMVVEITFVDADSEKTLDTVRFEVDEFLSPGEGYELPPLEFDVPSLDSTLARPVLLKAQTHLPGDVAKAEEKWNAEVEAKKAAEAEAEAAEGAQ
jgi:hypothetical protein